MALHRQAAARSTARSYLLAGFTAATIAAASSLAPRPTVHLPWIHFADVRFTAAESAISASDLGPLVGDLAALDFDLLGTPFAAIAASSFAADLAVSDLSSGLLGDIPGDVFNSLQFGIASRLSLLTADIGVLTNEVNHLTGIINPAPSSTSVLTRTAAIDPTAVGPLTGDAALLGPDVVATPFELTESLTNALSAAALDLGAGQIQDAEQDFASNLRLGLVEAQTRLGNDLNGIATSLARLTGATTSAPVVAETVAKTAAQTAAPKPAKPVSTRHSAELAGSTEMKAKTSAQQHSTPGKHRADTAKHHKH